MNTPSALFFGTAFVLYLLSGVLYLAELFNKAPRWTAVARGSARIGAMAHAVALLLHGLEVHHAPFTDVWESMSFFSWTILLFFLVLEWRNPLPSFGAFVVPLGFIAIFLASVRVTRDPPLVPVVQNHALKIHIAISLMGYASFALSFGAALAYLVQERRLKTKRIGMTRRFLSLEQADHLANRLAGIGFALLTLGLLMGLHFASRDWRGLWLLDPKVILSFITWMVYGIYLYLRSIVGWRGHRTMMLLVAGFFLLLVSFIGINAGGIGRHAYPF